MNGPVCIRTMHGENVHLRLHCQEMTPNHLSTGNNKGSHSIDHSNKHTFCRGVAPPSGSRADKSATPLQKVSYSVYTHTFACSHEKIDIA